MQLKKKSEICMKIKICHYFCSNPLSRLSASSCENKKNDFQGKTILSYIYFMIKKAHLKSLLRSIFQSINE